MYKRQDYSCPFAYLGSTQVEGLARRMDADLVYRPMLLGGVFRAHGTPQRLFEAQVAAKAAHNLVDMKRWAALYGCLLYTSRDARGRVRPPDGTPPP